MAATSKLLEGKTALVTGATRGIGRAIAALFAANGANLFLNSRNAAELEPVCRELSDLNQVRCTPLAFDVSSYAQVQDAFQQLFNSGADLDIAVNNAGIMKDAMLGMLNPSLVTEVFGTNTFGTLYVMQHASRMMMKARKGSIVNVTSAIGVKGNQGQCVYSGSKAAIIGITKSAAKELSAFGIRVNAIAPGFIDTDLTAGVREDRRKQIFEGIAMKRPGTADEVARSCLFLASDLSEYITGQVISVDGGWVL